MFESRDGELPGTPAAAGCPVSAGQVSAWQESLTAAIAAPSGLDDAARVDSIRSLEELICTATATQAALSAELDASQRAEQAAAGMPAERQGRGIAGQVALARRESPHRGQRHIGLAKVVTRELPHTWTAWREGRITEWTATLIARETACLDLEDRMAVDEVVAGDPDRVEAMGTGEVVAACQREAARLDAAAVTARRRKAEADRHVGLRPAPDTMTWLTALLPVKEGVAAYAALTRAADSARAAGDERTRGQVMADTLVDSVLGNAAARDHAATTWDRPTPEPAEPSGHGGGIDLGLVMSDLALFGTSDEPAHLDGFGPIPAELAREIVADALSGGERTWVRRLYTAPETGELVSMDSRSRLFRNSLARFIRLRDQTCRTPWCDAPIRHTDHAEEHQADGSTSANNGQGLCEACNFAKQAPGWRARPSPAEGHLVETITPTGHRHRSRPPVLATIRTTPIRVDYVLAG